MVRTGGKRTSNAHDARWLREQLRCFVQKYSPLVPLDRSFKNDDVARGRAFGYEQCIGIVRAILEGVPFEEFRWDPKYTIHAEKES